MLASCLFAALLLGRSALAVPTGDSAVGDLGSGDKVIGDDPDDSCDYGLVDCPEKKCDADREKSVICFFVDWADVWKEPGKYYPENIPSRLCTHVSYAFAELHNAPFTLHLPQRHNDPINKWYERIMVYKKDGVKVLLALGWGTLKASVNNRKQFVDSALHLLKKYNFDGLDIYFGEHHEVNTVTAPCPQNTKEVDELANIIKLVKELKSAFNGKYLLAATKKNMEECFDLSELCKLADWVSVPAHNFHYYTEGVTGGQTAMCGKGGRWGVHETVQHFLQKCPADKLVVGLPSFARTFTLAAAVPPQDRPQFGAPVVGPGRPGPITDYHDGYLAYHEVCDMINNDGYAWGFSQVNGSFAWKDDQFISYESQKDFARVACLVNQRGLRGVWVWTLDFDDWSGRCGCGNYPLMTTLNRHLRCGQFPTPPADPPAQCHP